MFSRAFQTRPAFNGNYVPWSPARSPLTYCPSGGTAFVPAGLLTRAGTAVALQQFETLFAHMAQGDQGR